MSVVVKENLARSGTLSADGNAGVTRQYTVLGVGTEDAAVTAIKDYLILTMGTPPNLFNLVLDTVAATEQSPSCWSGTATWKTFARRSQPAEGESQFNFEIGLEPVKIRHAVGGIAVFKATGADDWAPELLNDLGDGEAPDGVDIYEPTYEESETHWGPVNALTPVFRNKIKRLVGKVNDRPWKGWAAGEVLLRGVSGTRRGANDAELTFRWSVRENQSDLTIGGVSGISKQGWQYLWPRAKIVKEDGAEIAASEITHVCVATVFRTGNMTELGIGA